MRAIVARGFSPAIAGLKACATIGAGAVLLALAGTVAGVGAERRADLPELTQPVNDFAHVIDRANADAMDKLIRTLFAASGDVVVVATVPTIEGYGDLREYANRLFQNHGRGIGDKEKKNGLLIVLALRERNVWVEVGYGLEQWITDGFSGETSRLYMIPEFKQGRYGAGLRIGTERIIGRIAERRHITLEGVRIPREPGGGLPIPIPISLVIFLIILAMIIGRIGRGPRRGVRTWGGSGWSGWSSGVGPFGGGDGGGGGGGGGFGGGFGGFGGGSSGGGGGGGSW